MRGRGGFKKKEGQRGPLDRLILIKWRHLSLTALRLSRATRFRLLQLCPRRQSEPEEAEREIMKIFSEAAVQGRSN